MPATEDQIRQIAKVYDVPPWLVTGDIAPPRFPRLRWALRRVWPLAGRSRSSLPA